MNNDELPTVEEGPDGQLVVRDPFAAAVFHAVRLQNQPSAQDLIADSLERVQHFAGRVVARATERLAIVLVDVDDRVGSTVAEMLMPGNNWEPTRASGRRPVARGLANREPLRELLVELERLKAGTAPGQAEALDGVADTHAPVIVFARESVHVTSVLLR